MLGSAREPKGRILWIAAAAGCAVTILVVAIATDCFDGHDFALSTESEGAKGPKSAAVSNIYASDARDAAASGTFSRHFPPAADSDSGEDEASEWVSTHDRVLKHKALACTGPKDPINFEVFSAGSVVSGLPLTGTLRRCDAGAPADEAPANYVSYVYGHCEIAEGATGCALPLEIQTWPACQRSLAEYSFEGKPVPYRELPKYGGAEVVEIEFPLGHRIEVYTKQATIVVFAIDPALARRAVELLKSQEIGMSPVTDSGTLAKEPLADLESPSVGATEGDISCQS